MKNEIWITRQFFDHIMNKNPISLPEGQTMDDIWVLVKKVLTRSSTLEQVISFILNDPVLNP